MITKLLEKHLINSNSKEIIESRNVIENQPSKYENINNNFHDEMHNYDRLQYFNIYNLRIKELKPLVINRIKAVHPGVRINDDLLNAKGEETQAIIGVIFKNMPKRPNVLKGYDTINEIRNISTFITEKDEVFVEGVSGRLKLKFSEQCNQNIQEDFFFSGLVCGIM